MQYSEQVEVLVAALICYSPSGLHSHTLGSKSSVGRLFAAMRRIDRACSPSEDGTAPYTIPPCFASGISDSEAEKVEQTLIPC
jgi:hypothetical protein